VLDISHNVLGLFVSKLERAADDIGLVLFQRTLLLLVVQVDQRAEFGALEENMRRVIAQNAIEQLGDRIRDRV
jgi:hypothetical protein